MADQDSSLPPEAFGVLNKIASGEAQNYTELYGGESFDGYADHPRVKTPVPGTNLYSTAAGKYQFLAGTWDAQAAKLGLKDFSPASQDTAAWDLAKTTYAQKTGRDLAGDYAAGKPEWSALAGQWPSLGKSSPQGTGQKPTQAPGVIADGTGQAAQTNAPITGAPQGPGQSMGRLGQSPAMGLALLQMMAPHHQFTPVPYDPWAVAPKMGGSGVA